MLVQTGGNVWSGKGAVNNNNPLTRDGSCRAIFNRPAVAASQGLQAAGAVFNTHDTHRIVLRLITTDAPPAHFLRHHRPSQFAGQSGAAALLYAPGWMAVEYLHGVVGPALPDADELAALLYHLHQQRVFGWRIALSWRSTGRVAIRQGITPFWLRRLKRLQKNGEPRPLRLAPLHMDVHGDNIVLTITGLRLIDWGILGDGDIALGWRQYGLDERQHRQLADAYAARARRSTPGSYMATNTIMAPRVIMLKAGVVRIPLATNRRATIYRSWPMKHGALYV